MMKIKTLMLAMMAMMVGMTFTACSSDDDDDESNYQKYQKAVDDMVKTQKRNDKVILLVAFGSTWEQAYDTFDKVVSEYKSSFSGYDVYLSFSSAICINNARGGENTDPKDYYDPEHWLTAIGRAGYKQVVVQSLQVIPGEEYRRVRDSYVKDFMNNRNGDFTTAYMKSLDLNVVVGTPLMAEESDARNLANVLNQEADIKAAVAEGIVAFMGHGNPEGYDYYGGNIRYLQLENYLRELNPNYYVGTVDMDETYVEDVLNHIGGGDYTIMVGDRAVEMSYVKNNSKKGQLYPLMSIAGDHAHNDMAGEGEEYWDEEDEESEDNSWYEYFNHKGYESEVPVKNNHPLGLLELEGVLKVWINHTKNAEFLEDAYHSMYPEE